MMKRIEDLWKDIAWREGKGEAPRTPLDICPVKLEKRNRVHIIALGDVGRTVLVGLRLLGADVISVIGIYDLSADNVSRLEQEMNQIRYPFGTEALPEIVEIEEAHLFDCDVLIFCASKAVPPVGVGGDVRMAQLEANRQIAMHFGTLAKNAQFKGMVAIVSDPVDPLCKVFLRSSGLSPGQIRGYGLGVMHARALYYSEKDSRFFHYEKEGRAFGPHGEDLVIADSVAHYDDHLSRDLTRLAVEANLQVRERGFKPYIAPALSSAAISILLTLRGQWHYSSLYFGDDKNGAFLGIKNRLTADGSEYEDALLCQPLYDRIQKAYQKLYDLE